MSIEDKLLAIINNYNSDGYYAYGNIPAKKLQNASQNFPIDPSDTPLALIDTTVMGSAKTGLVIGLKGIYFRSDWTTKTIKNFLSWDDLSTNKSPIGNGAMYCIHLSNGCEFNMSGSSMKKEVLTNLLNQLISLYKSTQLAASNNQQEIVIPHESIKNENTLLIESRNLYQDIIPELLGICIAANGDIAEDEVDIACSLIDGDDLIYNAPEATDLLSQHIEKFSAERKKSKAVFKLKAATTISKLTHISEPHQKDRILIMLEALAETESNSSSDDLNEIISKIREKLT